MELQLYTRINFFSIAHKEIAVLCLKFVIARYLIDVGIIFHKLALRVNSSRNGCAISRLSNIAQKLLEGTRYSELDCI